MRVASGIASSGRLPNRSRATRAKSLQVLSPSSALSFSVAAIQAQRSPQTEGDIDLRGFFGLDSVVAAGYRELRSQVMIKGDGTEEKIHRMVLATSPNF
jgi:hypothetical protein